MLKTNDVQIAFRVDLDHSYREVLDRLFFFNRKQHMYRDRINQSIDEYSMPVLKDTGNRVSIVFRDEWMGQTLHILVSDEVGAQLIGVVIYTRDSEEMVTIVHLVLDEGCNTIFKQSTINIALIVFQDLIALFKKMKGLTQVRVYYTDRIFRINNNMLYISGNIK